VFSESATRLSGLASALLGWRPDDFWHATPEELATVLAALAPPPEASGDAALITQLKELFPDGSGN
jgi:Phage tail assembly chaperone protein, TAC